MAKAGAMFRPLLGPGQTPSNGGNRFRRVRHRLRMVLRSIRASASRHTLGVGRAIRDRRDDVVLATKFGNQRGEDGSRLGVNGKSVHVFGPKVQATMTVTVPNVIGVPLVVMLIVRVLVPRSTAFQDRP